MQSVCVHDCVILNTYGRGSRAMGVGGWLGPGGEAISPWHTRILCACAMYGIDLAQKGPLNPVPFASASNAVIACRDPAVFPHYPDLA